LGTLLDRYIFRELLSPFFGSLFALSFVIFAKEMLRLVDLLVSRGVGLGALFNIILHLLPSFLVLTLPIACLIASISAFSRLSFDNELTAMRTAGLSIWRLAKPVLLFSVCVFLVTLFLAKWGQPWSNVSLKGLALSLIQNQLNLALETGVFNEPVPGMVIYVPHPVEGSAQEVGVFISDQRNRSKPFIIVARSYQVVNDPQHRKLGLRLFHGSVHQIPKDIQQYHQVRFSTYLLWMDIPLPNGFGTIDRPTYQAMIQKLDETGWHDAGALRRLMEYYKDLGFPLASLLLGLLGLPVGIVSRRSGRIGGFAIGILIIIGFYVLNVLGEFLVTTLVISPFAGAWLPDVVILIATGVLFVRVGRR